jgi:peptidoglycan/LPS O-acetylase OafA/YrhL
MSTHTPYWPALDGLRGISIALVMMVHLPLIEPSLWFLCPGGKLGVDVFFALSGFLITSLLLTEIDAKGRIDLKQFYIRRALRLLPAFISVVLFALLIALFVGSLEALGLTRLRLTAIVLYFVNWVRAFDGPETWFLSHFWSLAIEEQFYFCWPLALVAALKFRLKTWTVFWIVLSFIAVSVIWKIALFTGGAGTRRIFFGSDTRGDGILVGCALAIALKERLIPSFLNANSARSLMAIGVLIVLTFAAVGTDQFSLVYCGGTTAVAFGAALIIAGSIQDTRGSHIRAALSISALRWLGRRSYGVYLWHWPMYELARLIPVQALVAPCAIAASIIVAALSYRYIEQPFLRMKDRASSPSVLTTLPQLP